MENAATIHAKCEGFAPVDYDLYVLGLLDAAQTQTINDHLERLCGDCLSGVRRSMRLWGVFTSTLGSAEPSAHFKERLQEIVGLSQSVLTFPRAEVVEAHDPLPKWVQIAVAITLAAMLTLCGWYAGHTSGALDHQHLVARMAQSEDALSSSQLEVQQQRQQSDQVRESLTKTGQADAISQLAATQDQLRRSEVELAQYKALLARGQRSQDEQKDILLLLSSPNVRVIPLKGSASSPGSLGYVLMVPNSKLVFVASNLTDLPNGREYQLWMLNKQSSTSASAGVFVPDETGHAFLQVDGSELVSNPDGFAVTEEPPGGSREPTGSKFLRSED